MKVLVIGAGASWSTKDVENGVVDGLRAAGVTLGRYAYEYRLAASTEYLGWVYRRVRRKDPEAPKPSGQDAQLHALGDVITRALAHDVDWIVVVSGMFVPRPFLDVLQRAGLGVAVVMTESPYDLAQELEWARCADLVWTNERSSLAAFQAVQPMSRYLPHAWRRGTHDVAPAVAVAAHDVVFVGTGFDERIDLLGAIDWTGIDLGLYGNWQRLRRRSPLRASVRGGITDNRTTAALYRRAKVGLNLYRGSMGWGRRAPQIAHAESLNPRAYELAASGCFHLSHARAEVGEVFGDLVPTFASPAACAGLIRQWLDDDAGRARVAAQLPACVAGHSWHERGRQMAADLEMALPRLRARIAQTRAA